MSSGSENEQNIEQLTRVVEDATNAVYMATELEGADEFDLKLARRKLATAHLVLARQELEQAQTVYDKAKQECDDAM